MENYNVNEPSHDAGQVAYAVFHKRRWLATRYSVHGDIYWLTYRSAQTTHLERTEMKAVAFAAWCDHYGVSDSRRAEMIASGHGR